MSIIPIPRVAIIVVAAGSGTRLGADAPKAFVGIDRHSILRHALTGVLAAQPAQVVVVAPAGLEGEALTEAEHVAGERRSLVSVVTGGESRQASVAAGLHAVWPDVEVVLVHDAARALTPSDAIDRVIEAVDRSGWGIVPVLPVTDTIKRIAGDRITGVVDRSELAAAQTPQGFARDILDTAYAAARSEFTDDAALVAAAGHQIGTVAGDARAFKITTRGDLERARHLLDPDADTTMNVGSQPPKAPLVSGSSVSPAVAGASAAPRVGVGTDAHAFGAEGTLWLAGLEWHGEPALSGHSDGDAVAHAIVDALLSAAGLGDIGSRFGTDRVEFAGAHAGAFLAHTRALLGEAGWAIGNVAVQVQAARPRFAERRSEAEAALSAALGGAAVSVSATTTDGLGFTGAAEGVQAFAVALLVPASR